MRGLVQGASYTQVVFRVSIFYVRHCAFNTVYGVKGVYLYIYIYIYIYFATIPSTQEVMTYLRIHVTVTSMHLHEFGFALKSQCRIVQSGVEF